MLQRVLFVGLLGAFAALGSGCKPCCSEPTGAGKQASAPADDQSKVVKPEKGDPLGAETRAPTTDEAKTFQLPKLLGKTQGQCVIAVAKDGPAEKAGLKVGDVLLALDANKLCSRDDIEDFLRVSHPGSKVKVLVKRAGTYKEETVTVTLGANRVEDKDKHFTWQYAGLAQLDAALAAAKKDGTTVLVGLSGADT